MRLDAVMDEVAAAMEQITGLRVIPYPPEKITPPAGYVSYPESVDFDEEYGRGGDQFTGLPIVLLSSKVTTRTARDTVAAWASGDGPQSIKRALEAWRWKTCDDVTVNSCTFDTEVIGAVTYLAVMFKATVVGPGGD
jgi:hypothetical protein